jgi:hypothetical protein
MADQARRRRSRHRGRSVRRHFRSSRGSAPLRGRRLCARGRFRAIFRKRTEARLLPVRSSKPPPSTRCGAGRSRAVQRPNRSLPLSSRARGRFRAHTAFGRHGHRRQHRIRHEKDRHLGRGTLPDEGMSQAESIVDALRTVSRTVDDEECKHEYARSRGAHSSSVRRTLSSSTSPLPPSSRPIG